MGGINVGRWLAGGFAASVVTFLMEGLWSSMYMEQVEAAMANLGLPMDMTGMNWVLAIVVSLIFGFTLVFLYAVARPRFARSPSSVPLSRSKQSSRRPCAALTRRSSFAPV